MASSLLCVFIASIMFAVSAVYCGPTVVLPLQPAVPASYPVKLHHLQARDRERHERVFKLNVGGGVNLSVVYDEFSQHVGFYSTKVMLGSPPKEFELVFDTGSDVTWVPCSSCTGCPRSIAGVPINSYDRGSSSTAEMVGCSHRICTGLCSRPSNQCTYNITYGDGDEVAGYYVFDQIHFDMITRQFNSFESVIFGCSTYESGMIIGSSYGILGFGPGDVSIISQLSSRGLAPKVFSHCLRRDDNGGGVLALGEIMDPKTVYTPLVLSAMSYNVDLQSIAVNGKLLPIHPAIFSASQDRGTLIDSGTAMAYLVKEAYDAFVSAINLAVSNSVSDARKQYYIVSSSTSLDEVFPLVNLNFAGGASMLLKPQEYLVNSSSIVMDDLLFQNGFTTWEIAFRKTRGGYNVFGDVILKEKIIVYDLARQRLGWANRDCSLPINVSVNFGNDESSNTRHRNGSSSRGACIKLLTGILLMHIYWNM